jgi:hypothetical protein
VTEVAPQLDYAPPARRRWLRRALALVAVVVVAAVAIRWGPAFRRRTGVLLDQRRCMNYSAPADQVVYDTSIDQYGMRESVTACYSPPWFTRLMTLGNSASAVVFLHGRTSPSGNRRLVCIAAEPKMTGTVAGLSIRPMWYVMTAEPEAVRGTKWNWTDADPFFALPSADRIYAGQPDASDPSHFTYDYETDGVRKTIDGWLQDDDTLKFRVREVSE